MRWARYNDVIGLIHAQALEAAGDLEGAQSVYQHLYEDSATRFLGIKGLALIAQRLGETQKAYQYFETALQLRPRSKWAVGELLKCNRQLLLSDKQNQDTDDGVIQIDREGLKKRLKLLDKGVKLGLLNEEDALKDQIELLNVAAHRAMIDENSDLALQYANEVIKKDKFNIEAVCLASRLLNGQNQLRKALRLIEKTWAQKPDPELARAYRDITTNKLDAAQQALKMERLAALCPDHPQSLLISGEALLERENYEHARRDLTRALELQPDLSHLYTLLAKLEQKQYHDNEASCKWLSKGLEFHKTNKS
ncbi:MAG: hypothetical protein AAF403_07685 [Pseudomonadota bacterium]